MSKSSQKVPGVQVRKYGTWSSPVSASLVAAGGLRLSAVALDGDDVYWLEGRPSEGGRYVLVRRCPDGTIAEVLPREANVRTRVHEYGGGAYAVSEGTVYYTNFSDQVVYRLAPEGTPEPLTIGGDPGTRRGQIPNPRFSYADFAVDHPRRQLFCVREEHVTGGAPENTLVRISLAGQPGASEVVASGFDFYSTPRISSDGAWLAWVAWRHPQMPWDGSELWVAAIEPDGRLDGARRLAGGDQESIYQPGWAPDGALYFVSDRDGWWKLYRFDTPAADGSPAVAVVANPPLGAEFGRPQWVLGTATWVFAGPSRLIASYTQKGAWRLASVDLSRGTLSDLVPNVVPHEWLVASPSSVVLVGRAPTRPDAILRLDLDHGSVETLRTASAVQWDAGSVSTPKAIEFPTKDGLTAHAFYYAPRSADFIGPPRERPPLIVMSHGGPTSSAGPTFDLGVQFWTSRGFAVVDVNYGGSSGYGRAYRERLNGQWGVVDVEDCINAARYLVAQRKTVRRRLIIRGGSAGGYTTLAALAFRPDVFAAGASYYGISDIEALAHDTHKFESRYLNTLVGPYPQMKDLYRVRSPIHFVRRLSCPLILFQGLEDKVVPPSQSEEMANALRAKGIPVVYLTFEGEQHGFRKAETIIRCLEQELAFYLSVLG